MSSQEKEGKVCLSFFLSIGEGREKWGEERGENRLRMCLCASACGMCVVFVRKRWVAWGHGGRRWRECEKSTTLPHCAFLPATHPSPSPALAVLSIRLPPLSIRTSGVACLARRHGCLLGWWWRWSFQGRWRATE